MRWRQQRLFFQPFWPRGAVAVGLLVTILVCFLLATPDRWLVLLVLVVACFSFGWTALPFAGPKIAVAPQGVRVDGLPFWWRELDRIVIVREPRSITFFPRPTGETELRAKRVESRPPLTAPVLIDLPRVSASLEELCSEIRGRFDGDVELHERAPADWRHVD